MRLHLRLRLGDGTVAEDTFGDEPLDIVIGAGQLAPGLERVVEGLAAGERRTLELGPDEAFGPRDPDNIHELPRSDFPADMELARGVVVGFTTPGGDEVGGTVLEAGDERVRVDLNHPLAGQVLTVEVEVLEVGEG